MRLLLALLMPFWTCGYLFAGTVTVQSKTYSHMAKHLMHDHGHNALYQVQLENVAQYLPEQHDIKYKSMQMISRRRVPGKTPISIVRHCTCKHRRTTRVMDAYGLFSSLEEEKTHTYVVLDNVLRFTQSTDNPLQENMKDKLTKHYLLSKLSKTVRFSGELHVYKNPMTNEVFAVFDNSSGTYKPDAQFLPGLQQLLDQTFNTDNDPNGAQVYFVAKKYNQKIDKEKLFAHEENPYLEKT